MCPPPHRKATWGRVSPAVQNERPSVRVTDWGTGGASHLATKFLPGVPPYFPNFENFLACCSLSWDPNRFPTPPVTVGVRGGVRPFRILRPKFCQGFSPICQILIFPWPVAASVGTPVAYLPPPCAPRRALGG